MRTIVLGYIVRGPLGGLTWHHLQYVLGLADLGHEVYFLEDSDDYPSCYNPKNHATTTDPRYGLDYTRRVFDQVGLNGRWAYYDAHSLTWHGPSAGDAIPLCETADVVLNLSGVNPLRPWLLDIPHRVFIDTDPLFTQLRHLSDPAALRRVKQHTHFFSFGENIGSKNCRVPDDGFTWRPTRQPIVLRAWPATTPPHAALYTTVMQWDSYEEREYQGKRYGMKSATFKPYMNLPSKAEVELELAIGSDSAPRAELSQNGWLLRNPLEISSDPWTYQAYIRNSKAEFSVAKQGYVASNSGWFSERSACYLASGRPVLVQQTGFSEWLRGEAGVIPFASPEQAIDGIRKINGRYDFHCRMARAIASDYFDSKKVLTSLIERL